MKQILEIQGQFPSLNEVISVSKTHWSHYAKMKKQLTTSVALQARAAKLKPVTKPVRVSCHWYEKSRRRDVDNISHGCKYLLDGLVEAGVLEDDSQRHVPHLEHHFDFDRDNPRVRITIEDL